ncbi:MAG: MFS transporter [bacterium]|nr:MFS transporter [bacterium]
MTQKKISIIFAFILGFVGFVTSFGAHIVAVNLPTYAEKVGVGLGVIGVLIAAYDFAEIVAKPVFGALADKKGMKLTMLVGLVVFIIASLLYLIIPPQLLLLVRFLQGIGAAALSAVSLALVGVYFKDNRGRAYGIYNAVKGAGYVLSPLVGGYIVLKSNFATIFVASAIIGIIAFILSLFLPKPSKGDQSPLDDDDNFSLKSFTAVFKQKELLPWYVITVVNMFFVGILFGFLPIRIHELHYSPFNTGLLISVVALSYLLIQPVAGILADKASVTKTITVGLILSAVSVILIPFVKDIPLLLVSIVAGIGVGTVWTNTDTLMSNLAKEGKLGETMGIAGSFKEFGDMLGPLLIGMISQAFGLKIGFVTCGVLGLLCVVLIRRSSIIAGR